EVEVSSEFRYRETVFDLNTLVMTISQSGETADTLAGLREAKTKFLDVLSIVNVPYSSIARESDGVIYINAGPEIGVASTKAYTAEVLNIFLFALYLGRIRNFLTLDEVNRYLKELSLIAEKMERVLSQAEVIKGYSDIFYEAQNFIFLGRGINYPSALEGALKLKEISYIHSTGYAGGEMKHGPIALIDENTPVVGIAVRGTVYDKMMSNIEEVVARRGVPILIGTEGDNEISRLSRYPFFVPLSDELVSPLLTVIPLQLLAYFIALRKNCDVDRPRNLAKSVTVE
ncbi:MAG: SIS domain-containing protein, partial [candidate division WOR-3 bacterium]